MLNNIESKIKRIIAGIDEITVTEEEISINESLISYGFNSIIIIKVLIAIEKEFDIVLDDDHYELDNFHDLKSLIEFVENELG